MPTTPFVGAGQITALNEIVMNCDELLQEKIRTYQNTLSASRSAADELDRINEHAGFLKALTDAIHLTLKEGDSESNPGVKAAIDIIPLYHDFLNNKTTIEKVMAKCTTSLQLLPGDIQNCRINIDKGQRMKSALYGLGYAIAGFGFSLFMICASLGAIISGRARNLKEMWSDVRKPFLTAFDQFKETWTGKKEPPEMKKLEKMLREVDKQLTSTQTVTGYGSRLNFYSLEQQGKATPKTPTDKLSQQRKSK